MRRLAGLLFSCALFIALAEGSGYLALQQVSGTALSVFEGIRLDDSVLTLKPNHVQRWSSYDEFNVTVRTNSRGFREDMDFQLSDLDVALFGDSFTFGHGVEADERYSAVLAKHLPGKRVASLAYVAGYEPEHYEFYLNTHRELAPKLAVIGLYLGNDMESDIRETRIRQSSDGRIIDVDIPYKGIFEGVMVNASIYKFDFLPTAARHSYFVRYALSRVNTSPRLRNYLFKSDAIVPGAPNSMATDKGHFGEFGIRALESLRRFDSIVKERGGQLVVMVIPQNYLVAALHGNLEYISEDLNPGLIGEIPSLLNGDNIKDAVLRYCHLSGLQCIDALPALAVEDYFMDDGHWNANGQRKGGELLVKSIGELGLFKDATAVLRR
jgi:hypothetical protein